MKKKRKNPKPMGFFNVGFLEKKNIGSNQIGPNQAHPDYKPILKTFLLKPSHHIAELTFQTLCKKVANWDK